MKMIAGRDFARLGEQLADAAGADADDHLDELRGAGAEERHFRLAGRGAGQQRLAGPGRAGEQHALRRAGAEPAIFVGILQEVDDLVDLRFDLVDAGDIVEGDADGLRIDRLLLARRRAARRPSRLAGA